LLLAFLKNSKLWKQRKKLGFQTKTLAQNLDSRGQPHILKKLDFCQENMKITRSAKTLTKNLTPHRKFKTTSMTFLFPCQYEILHSTVV
jgi:hypothetical protein